MSDPLQDPRFLGAVDVIKRTGARSFQIRYSDDEQPTVWIAVVEWRVDKDGIPAKHGAGRAFEAMAAMHPAEAVFRLASQVVDGGTCAHCGKPTMFNPDVADETLLDPFCWWSWEPETSKYVQACQI